MQKQPTYKITDTATGIVLAENVSTDERANLIAVYEELDYEIAVTENAAAGSTSAGSIAVNMAGGSQYSIKSFLAQTRNDKVEQIKYKNTKPYFITVTEAFDFGDVVSRLSSMEKSGKTARNKGTTFGIEDDNKNIMKVTVRADQAEEFETDVAAYLADIKTNIDYMPSAKNSKEVSMAELLYKMKDKFDIIDVEFPDIPTDVVYNADDASVGVAGDNPDFIDLDDAGEMGDMPPMDGEIGDMPPMGDEMGEDDLATDMEAEPVDGESSILNQVISMLKAQADAETEKAKAAGEVAKAEQAKYSALAANNAMAGQEDKLRYEAEMEMNAKREKEAKEKADIAKYKISKTLNMASGVSESSEGDTPQTVQRERQGLAARYAINPDDPQDVVMYKNAQKAEATKEINARYRQAVNRMQFDKKRKLAAAQASNQPQNQNQNQGREQVQGNQQNQQNQNGRVV